MNVSETEQDDPTVRDPVASPWWRPRPFDAGVVVALLVLLSGCASLGGGGGDDEPPGRYATSDYRTYPVRVKVINLNWSPIHVWLVAGGQRESMGVLSSQQEETYVVPPGILGEREEIRLLADPIGQRGGFLSETIFIEPGDLVEWRLQNNLALSSVFVK